MIRNQVTIQQACNYVATFNFPIEFFMEMIKWQHIVKSPYSLSFYSHETDWNKKEDKSFRISDHWNFITSHDDFEDRLHCITDKPVPKDHWAIGRYDIEQKLFVILDIKNPTIRITRTKEFRLLTMNMKYEEDTIRKQAHLGNEIRRKIDYGFLKKYYCILEETEWNLQHVPA
jgi:hypothetical protein